MFYLLQDIRSPAAQHKKKKIAMEYLKVRILGIHINFKM